MATATAVRQTLEVADPESGWTVPLTADCADSVGCRLWEVTLRRTTPLTEDSRPGPSASPGASPACSNRCVWSRSMPAALRGPAPQRAAAASGARAAITTSAAAPGRRHHQRAPLPGPARRRAAPPTGGLCPHPRGPGQARRRPDRLRCFPFWPAVRSVSPPVRTEPAELYAARRSPYRSSSAFPFLPRFSFLAAAGPDLTFPRLASATSDPTRSYRAVPSGKEAVSC